MTNNYSFRFLLCLVGVQVFAQDQKNTPIVQPASMFQSQIDAMNKLFIGIIELYKQGNSPEKISELLNKKITVEQIRNMIQPVEQLLLEVAVESKAQATEQFGYILELVQEGRDGQEIYGLLEKKYPSSFYSLEEIQRLQPALKSFVKSGQQQPAYLSQAISNLIIGSEFAHELSKRDYERRNLTDYERFEKLKQDVEELKEKARLGKINDLTKEYFATIKVPKEMTDLIGKPKEAIEIFIDKILHADKYPAGKKNHLLYYGKPGTGKTLQAEMVAQRSGAGFLVAPTIADKYVGESEKKIAALFQACSLYVKKNNKPCIIFFDEVDSFALARGGKGTEYTQQSVNQMLKELTTDYPGVYAIGACNVEPTRLDPAIVRAGRFGEHIEFKDPDTDERKDLATYFTKKYLVTCGYEHMDEVQIAKMTHGLSHATIDNVFLNLSNDCCYKRKQATMKDLERIIHQEKMKQFEKNASVQSKD